VYVAETTPPENLAGTLAYIAPEQTGRMNRSVDARADLYSLGVTLYQLLTGVLPFETVELSEIIHAHLARTPMAPHERVKGRQIPKAVSAIIQKLLAKNPDDRYQTAEGTAFDLERAAGALAETGTVPLFELATRDWENRVRKPSRLFGREQETAALLQALTRVAGGAVELALVSGHSGVGKSALVQALRESVQARHGIFAPGKFDQLQRGTPYLAFSQALRSIVRRRLADPSEALAAWKVAWQEAAGPNGRILIDLMPELVHILGEPPPLAEVGPLEAKHRFRHTLLCFIRATATQEHPLVLFIDDLQWADTGTVALLQDVLTDHTTSHVLLLGTYRDNEVDEGHAIHLLRKALEESGRRVHCTTLEPLGPDALTAMVADMLREPADKVQPLAQVTKAKTDGSPFFVEQFLRALHEQRLLQRDSETGAWHWDIARIERAHVTDNVVDLLTQKISEIAKTTQRVLSLGACVGAKFTVELLAESEGMTADAVRMGVEEAVREGLLFLAIDAEHESYEFVHDRVQQAAYAALEENERIQVHHALALATERVYGKAAGDAELFTILYHHLLSLQLLAEREAKHHVAELCLRGGQRAKAGATYTEAAKFLRAGQSLLGDLGWEDSFALSFELHLTLAEAEWNSGRVEAGDALFRKCMERAADRPARARVASLWVTLLTLSGRFAEALELGLSQLAELGWQFPRNPSEIESFLATQFARIRPTVMAASAKELSTWKRCTDLEAKLAGALLARTALAAGVGKPELFPPMSFALVEHTLRYGISGISAVASTTGAIVSILLMQDLDLAARLVELGQSHLQDASGMAGYSICGLSIARQYLAPLHTVCDAWLHGSEAAQREGDVSYTAFCLDLAYLGGLLAGRPPLGQPPSESGTSDFVSRALRRALSALYLSLSSGQVADAVNAARAWVKEVPSVPFLQHWVHACAAFLALHLGDTSAAWEYAISVEPYWLATFADPNLLAMVFALCLAAQRHPDKALPAQAQVDAHRARLEKWAAFTPQNYLHMKLLVDACEAWREGRQADAERLFSDAITDAHSNGFANDEALGLRLFGEYSLERGRQPLALAYLQAACDAYRRWGAATCAAAIREKYPSLFPALPSASQTPSATGSSSLPTRISTVSATADLAVNKELDAAVIMHAAQALSSELVLGSLIGRMLHLLAENAGAERAVLVLTHEGSLRIEAELVVNSEQLTLDLDEPLLGSSRLPGTLIQYIERGKEPVVLSQAQGDHRFADDPYLRSHQPASILAVPLVHQGRLSGVMYLEHSRAAQAFPKERVELASLLASQAATAVENARLYAQVQATSQELRRLNQGLETQVAARTAALQKAMADLWAEMDLAQKIQTVLLPSSPQISGYDLAAVMRPAAQIGGDYYDVFHQGGKDWVLIGDVSGHGVSAGLCMMMIQSVVRATALTLERARQPLTPRQVLSLVNEGMANNLKQIGGNKYMTVTALCLQGGTVRYAGLHLDLLIYRAASHKVDQIETQGVWVGVTDDIDEILNDSELVLEEGDILLLYTDGYTEATVAGRMLETAGLAERFVRLAEQGLSSAALLEGLMEPLAQAVVSDDVTLIALRRLRT